MRGSWGHVHQPLRILSATCFLVMCGVTAHARAERVTIDEAVRLALQNNTALQAQQHTIAVVEGELRQARTFPHNPRLEGEGLTGREGMVPLRMPANTP